MIKSEVQKIISGSKSREVIQVNKYTDKNLLLKAVMAALVGAKAIIIVK